MERKKPDKMKRKIHRHQIKKVIKFNSILCASRCTARKDETYLRYTFFDDAKFV